MNLTTISNDIKKLENALRLIEKTENFIHFDKSKLIFDLCEQINVLKDKGYKQMQVQNYLKTN